MLALTQVWYRVHDKGQEDIAWTVALPETKPAFERIEISPRTLELLKYDTGAAATWKEEGGAEWIGYYCRWEGKSVNSLMASRSHRPEVCLPAAGLKQISESQIESYDVGGLKLPFRKAAYSALDQVVYVFYCLWQDGDERRRGMRAKNLMDRLYCALEGKRRYGQRSLEIITKGYPSMAEASRAVRQRLPDLVRVEPKALPAIFPEKRM